MDLQRFRGLIAIQAKIGEGDGGLSAVLDAIVNERSVMPQANGVVIELRDGDQLYYAAASGTSAASVGLRLPLNASLSGMSILTGQPLICEDSESDARVNRAACRRVGLRSMIVVPIPHQGQTAGVLKYHAPETGAFDEEDMLVAHLLVGPIAVGLSRIAEVNAERAHAELQKLVRLKEQFVSSVSHELRTPLTSISGALGLFVAKGGANPLVDIAIRNTARLRRLVDDLLDMDRIDSGKFSFELSSTDLSAVLREAVEQNAPFATENGVKLALDLPKTTIFATSDAERLLQVVTNLLSNGAKFSPQGSTVTVSLRGVGHEARIREATRGPASPTISGRGCSIASASPRTPRA